MIAEITYGIVALIGFLFGSMYLFKKQCMPYHLKALEQDWEDISKPVKTLCLALMRVAGGGYLAMGISISFLLYSGISNNLETNIALLLIGSCGTIPSLYATIFVKRNTKGNPPVKVAFLSVSLVILAFIFSVLGI